MDLSDTPEVKAAQRAISDRIVSLFDKYPNGVFWLNPAGEFTRVNQWMMRITGYDPDSLRGKPYIFMVNRNDLEFVTTQFMESLEGHAVTFETRIQTKMNHPLTLSVTLVPIKTEDAVEGVFGVARDITQENEREAKLRKTIKDLADVKFAIDQFAIFTTTDAAGRIIDVNDRFCEISGFSREELLFKTHRVINSGVHPKEFFALLWGTIRQGRIWHGEVCNKRKDGTLWWASSVIVPFVDEYGVPFKYMAFREDTTERKMLNDKLTYELTHDALTQLPNRKRIEEIIGQRIHQCSSGGEFGIALISLKRFRTVNQSLGFEKGDLVLLGVAQRIQDNLDSDDALARFGGDEFLLVTSTAKRMDEVREQVRRIISSFDDPFLIEGQFSVSLNVAAGIAWFPAESNTIADLIRHAAVALTRAKEAQRANAFDIYTRSAGIESYIGFTLANDLMAALKNNQFELYYQPVLDAETNQVCRAEALVRWNHPDWGTVLPSAFIPIAESTGTITELTEWVMRSACEQLNRWHDEGYKHLKVAINVTGLDLMKIDFPVRLLETIQTYDLRPDELVLEVVESILLDNHMISRALVNLRNRGFKIAIDDFGTGYSSLSYLQTLPVDEIKLDKSFLKNFATNETAQGIVDALIRLAHRLDLSVVAEGVEAAEALTLLKSMECDKIQGYLVSRPIPASEFETFLGAPSEPPVPSGEAVQVDRRKVFRLAFPLPLRASVRIDRVRDNKITSASTVILVENIGPGGLRFVSDLKLPNTSHVIYLIETTLLDEPLVLPSHVVWSEEFDEHLFRYGVQFHLTESQGTSVVRVLNQLAIRMRLNNVVPGCDFVSDVTSVFKRSST